MAYIEPNTEIRFLVNVPLDPDYENTLYFNSINEQTNYFYNRTRRVFQKQSYQRKNRGWLRVGWEGDRYGDTAIKDLFNSTYMMFRNSNFENKWFYAFVDSVEYVNNNTVDVQYHIDVLQTWHFDYVLNQCFIERQHVSNDTAGANTIPEGLEHGPYICDRPSYMPLVGDPVTGGDFKYTPGILLATSFNLSYAYQGGRIIPGWGSMGHYFSGVWYTTFDTSAGDIAALNSYLETISADEAKADGVISMSMIPLSLVDPQGSDYAYNDILFTMPTSLGSYTPRNKKLLTNPYNFMYVTNNQGQSGEFYWEDSYNRGYMEFRVWANYATTPAMLCAPVEYKISSHVGNYDEMLTVQNFPICAWTNDAFKAWFAQNAGSVVATGLGLFTNWMNAITPNTHNVISGGGIASVINQTLDVAGEVFDHSRRPPQVNGNSNGNLVYQASLMTFSFYRKFIKPEYAAIIDKYFDMYGYAVHTVGTPNRAVRRCYTYVKTVGCSIHGNLPNDDITEIQNIFNSGIRFWRSTADFGNYDPSVNDNTV